MKKKSNFDNEEYNKLPLYRDKKCIFCGRSYPETILNVEGHIHHGEDWRCLDQKTCRTAKRKNKWKKVKTE